MNNEESVLITADDLHRIQDLERTVFVSADYEAQYGDDYVFVDSTAGAVNITLPLARGGQHATIVRRAGGNNVTVLPTGTDTVNDAASVVISTSFVPLRLKAYKGIGYLGI